MYFYQKSSRFLEPFKIIDRMCSEYKSCQKCVSKYGMFKEYISQYHTFCLQSGVVVPNPQPQDLFQPVDIAIDPYSRHLYWSDSLHNVINVTRLDMQAVGVIVDGQKPRSIALAPQKG